MFFLYSWARLELLAGLLQEVLLLSISFSIIVDAINKLINPMHIEDPSAMIYLGIAGFGIGLLGLFLFRGYHHDHNIGHEIVEQKKNDFLESVYDTLKDLHMNHSNLESPLVEQRSLTMKPALVINETSINLNEQTKHTHESIIPSVNDAYTNVFLVVDKMQQESVNHTRQQLSTPEKTWTKFQRLRTRSEESAVSSMLVINDDKVVLDDEFEESRVYATLHALCLHSLVNIKKKLLKKFKLLM